MKSNAINNAKPAEVAPKSRDEIKAEREAKKLAKQAAKGKKGPAAPQPENQQPTAPPPAQEVLVQTPNISEKKENKAVQTPNISEKKENKALQTPNIAEKKESMKPDVEVDNEGKENQGEGGKSKAQLKAERRAKQEAQRAKKVEAVSEPAAAKKVEKSSKVEPAKPAAKKLEVTTVKPKVSSKEVTAHRVKLFAHLYAKADLSSSALTGIENVHPNIARLGAQYRTRVVCGSNVRCLALLSAFKRVILDYKTPASVELGRGLDAEMTRSLEFLKRCRPISESMNNAVKHLRGQLTKLKGTEEEVKEELIEWIEVYVKDQLEKAAEAISISVRQKIADNDVILTYSCSSLVQKILIAAAREGIKFRVIVVDGRPWLEGRQLLRSLLLANIPCTYILVNAVSFVMPEVTKILLGAHALLANGYVMSRCGSSQVALLGRAANVPVLVCCETHKFSERVQTDSFVHNELGNPNELAGDVWKNIPTLTPLNLVYDVTPPDLVSAVVTELAILPCTSVPVILRFK